jgi:hypothetical protein
MRTLIGTSIGLLLGFILGLLAMRYLGAPAAQAPQRMTKQGPVLTESYFICKPEHGRESSLIIKSEDSAAKELVFPWKTDADSFFIEKTTEMYYVANNTNPEAPEAHSTIELNRVTGEFTIINRRPRAVVTLLMSICERRVPPTECRERVDRIPGGSWIDCLAIANDVACPGLSQNSNISGRFRYQCRAVERRL